jgi:hypothetical protein
MVLLSVTTRSSMTLRHSPARALRRHQRQRPHHHRRRCRVRRQIPQTAPVEFRWIHAPTITHPVSRTAANRFTIAMAFAVSLIHHLVLPLPPSTAAVFNKLTDIASVRLITSAIQPLGARNQTGTTTRGDVAVITRSRQSSLTLQVMGSPLQTLPTAFTLIWLEMVRAN